MPRMSLRSGQELRAKPPRRRHWWRWALGGVLALVVIVVVAVVAIVRLQPSQPPLALPAAAAAAPAGQLDGTWHVTTGSVAGFRVRESILGVGNDVTGRTSDVTGTAVLTGRQVARATFRVSLDAITVNGKARQPQLVQSLTRRPTRSPRSPWPARSRCPPCSPREPRSPGRRRPAHAERITRPTAVTLSARRDGPAIEAAGSLPVAFADFGIKGPRGYGVFGIAGQQRDG